MYISNCILKILNILDTNITFNENCVNEEVIKNKRCLILTGYLDEHPNSCHNCGVIKDNNIIKFGTKTSLIKIPKISELNSYLKLKKQRYKCLHCNSYFTSCTPIINYRCRISNNTKLSIINYLKHTITHKDIAWIHNVSNMTIQRTSNKIYDNDTLYKNYLSENLCFDEFTFEKRTMSFNICDADTGKTIDIVENRNLETLEKYFNYYSIESRSKVKHIVIDMYKPYLTLINKCFPNAKIIIDMFHIVQLLNRSLNKTRILVMNKDKENYRKFKRYWRLILTSRLDLDKSRWKKYICFKNLMTEVDIVNYLINTNEELKATYNLYQSILYALQHKNYEILKTILETEQNNISKYMITSVETLKEFLPYIKNTLENKYSNGVMERNNNTCKLLKRIAFGYRNFKNFKSRIMIITSLFRPIKNCQSLSSTSP